MNIIGALIILPLCCSMFFIDRTKQLTLLIVSLLCLNFVSIGGFSFSDCYTMVALSYIIRHIPRLKYTYKQIRHTPIFIALCIVIVGAVIQIITSPHLHNAQSVVGYVINFITRYFVFVLVYVDIRNRLELKKFLPVITTCLYILIFVAVFQYFTGVNLGFKLLGLELSSITDIGIDRRRINSLFISPFDFGFTCVIIFLFILFARQNKWVNSRNFYILTAVSLIGVLICGCRTVLACYICSLIAYSLVKNYAMKNVVILILGTVALVTAYTFVPWFHDKVDFLLSAFDKNSKVGGSSVDMRIYQYLAVLYHIRGHLLFGRGYRFFQIDMGWGEDTFNTLRDLDLMGLEGILMNKLLESGIIGVLVYLLFWGILAYCALRRYKLSKVSSAITFALIVNYIVYGNMTGELDSLAPTLFMLALIMKPMSIEKVVRHKIKRKKKIKKITHIILAEHRNS